MIRFWYLVAVLLVVSRYVTGEKYVICYYDSDATEYSGLGKFGVGNINPMLCTHAVYLYAEFDTYGIIYSKNPRLDLPDKEGRNYFGLFNELKRKNPNLKTLLSVGGARMADPFSIISANATLRKNFVTSAFNLLQKYGFDGLEINWKYPTSVESTNGDADVKNFVDLLRETKELFRTKSLILGATMMAVRFIAFTSYNIPDVSRFLDLINLMTYDYNGSWDNITGHIAPLHKSEGEEKKSRKDCFSVDIDVAFWLLKAPREKLVIGLPFYGRSFNLSDPGNSNVTAPSSGISIVGKNIEKRYIGYNEFCIKLRSEPWTQKYDHLAKVPYAVNERKWVSYENAYSIAEKVQYAMKLRLAGVFIWTIDLDDFQGTCGDGDFPLLRAVNKAMGKSII